MKMQIVSILLLSCIIQLTHAQQTGFDYGTKNPEAFCYYEKGWEYILDKGQWGKAEEAFRTAVEKDPDFSLGWSQVGRISHDPKERVAIFEKLKKQKEELNGLEKSLLEVYLASLEIIDSKDRGIPITPEKVRHFYQISEQNFSDFLKYFPNERYVHAEYIEVIHGIYGAKACLDSLENRQNNGMELIPFLISYKAQLLAESGQFDLASQTAEVLEKRLNDPDLPIIPFTYGYIAFEKRNDEEASKWIYRTLQLDAKHVIAQRLLKKIQDQLVIPAK